MKEEFPIFLNENVFKILKRMRNGLIKQIGDNATYNSVIHILIKEHYKLQALKKDIKILEDAKKDVENKHSLFLQDIMLKQQNIPVIYQGSPSPVQSLTPPPAPPSLQDMNKLKEQFDNIEISDKIKDDLGVELSILNGKILKPSQVMKLTGCKHKKTKLEKKKEYNSRKEKHMIDVKNKTFKRNNVELEEKSIVLAQPEKFKKKIEI